MPSENNKDNFNPISFGETLKNLSLVEKPIALKPENIDVLELRNNLIFAGINIDLIEKEPDLESSIQSSKLRNKESGRGPAVVAAFGGESKYDDYFHWAMEKSVDQPKLSKGVESSKARGLMQFAADTIALAAGVMTKKDYCRKTNWRIGKKYQNDPDLAREFDLPTDPEGQQKLKETSSIPKGQVFNAYEKLLQLNKT
jgi:hypothetical protein